MDCISFLVLVQISSTFLHESLKAQNPSPPELPPRLPAKTAQKTQPLEAAAEETTPPFVRADSQLSQVSSVAFEGIYDIVPTPRSCLSRRQLEYNDIYDVPRKLIAKNQHQNSKGRRQQQQQPATGVMHQRPPSFDRSVSVFDTRHSSKRVRSTSTVSVGKMPEDTAGIRRANYVSNLGIFSSQVTVCQD